MAREMRLLLASLAVTALLSAPLSGQWFTLRTPNVPRLASGAPNLKAPAPKTADGKPDFSGIWLAGNPLPCPPFLRDGNDCIEKIGLSRQTANIGMDLPGGLPYQPWAAALAKQRATDLSKDDPHVKCLPSNIARFWTLPHYTKILQTRDQLAMLNEFNASYRQIFMDGRALPVDPQPSWNGYSSGRWAGDTLVVETNGLRDGLWLDMAGNPMTDAAKVTERIRRPDYGSLEIEFTVNDLKAYTKPWTVLLKETIVVDTEILDEICLENEKSLQHLVGK
jgi:hypothetical protein